MAAAALAQQPFPAEPKPIYQDPNKYTNARVSSPTVTADGNVSISVDVANVGALAGDEVVQLYLTHGGATGAPRRALAGFLRVHLNAGERKSIMFQLANRQRGVVDEKGNLRIVAGTVNVWIGGGQPMTRAGRPKVAGAETKFTIAGAPPLPE